MLVSLLAQLLVDQALAHAYHDEQAQPTIPAPTTTTLEVLFTVCSPDQPQTVLRSTAS